MNLDFYRNFVVVAESYTISEAARRLNIAQPALSMQLKNLESYYGVRLVKTRQGSRHLELTPAGELLYRRMRHILNETEVLRMDLKSVAFNELETITIGTTPELSNTIADYIHPFSQDGVLKRRWKVWVRDVSTLADYLDRGEIHCMIVPYTPSQIFLYDFQGAFCRPIHVVGHKEHPVLQDKSYLRMASLDGTPICLSHELEDAFFMACREEQVDIPIFLRCTSTPTVIDAALRHNSLGLIGGILPSWMAEAVAAVPLRSRYIRAQHYVYTQKGADIPTVTQDFLAYLKSREDYLTEIPDTADSEC